MNAATDLRAGTPADATTVDGTTTLDRQGV